MNLDTEIIYCLRYDVHRWSWLGAYITKRLNAQIKELTRQVNLYRRELVHQRKRITGIEKVLKFQYKQNNFKRNRKKRLRITGKDIISIRERLNLSQTKFAELLGIDRAPLNRWEHGKVKISQRSMQKIAPYREMGKKELQRRLQAIEAKIWND